MSPVRKIKEANEDICILTLAHWPARLNLKQACDALGFKEHEGSVLIKEHHLVPLGGNDVPVNGHKFFSAVEVLRLSQDEAWLSKATKIIYRHWKNRNQKELSAA